MNDALAKEMNLPSGTQGVLIEQVQPGSLADTTGLRGGTSTVTINGQQIAVGGDIITAVNGQSVASLQELRAVLAQLTSNQALSLSILRNGTEIQITVQPGQ
jgi:S1-C subfamily serine protease